MAHLELQLQCKLDDAGIGGVNNLSESGPDHSKLFTCAVFIGDEQIAIGKGNTKQKAEQDAARAGLKAKGWK